MPHTLGATAQDDGFNSGDGASHGHMMERDAAVRQADRRKHIHAR
jgi:hypothetical protein